MIRLSMVTLAAALGFAACQPAKTPEQIAAENAAKAAQEMAAAFGAAGGQLSPEQLAAALGQAGALAAANDPTMTPEQRVKLQAVTGALQSGQVHPAASAWLEGANKAFTLLGTVKNLNDANAVEPQLQAIYAGMAGPAATLNAMNEDQRDIAFGSALPQMMQISMSAMSLMAPLANNPEMSDRIGELLEDMPQPE
jgi:hypothetical protein